MTTDGGAGCRAGVAGQPTEQEQAGSPSMCGAERSRSLVSSFPYLTDTAEETDVDTVIKKCAGAEQRFIGLVYRPTKASERTDVLYITFPLFLWIEGVSKK